MVTDLSRFKGCLMGLQVGDALGVPWEIMASEDILSATGGKGIQGFSKPSSRSVSEWYRETVLGNTSDDTQLAFAVARSLIRRKEFDAVDCALEHVREAERTMFGWGSTTRDGIKEFKDYFDSRGERGRHPFDCARAAKPGEGCGNGVAMKVAPLALYWSRCDPKKPTVDELYNQVRVLGLMTHPDERASMAAFAVFLTIKSLLHGVRVDTDEFASRLFSRVLVDVSGREHLFGIADGVSGRLRRIQDADLLHAPASRVCEALGTECFALESVSTALAVFFRHPSNFKAGLLEAVNMGGDTDTIAAMAGAMIGASVGLEGIPEEWQNFKPEYLQAASLAEQLCNVSRLDNIAGKMP